ncbi:MAG: hypothetical protein ACXWKG_19915 [Limisphaerales bacterium]
MNTRAGIVRTRITVWVWLFIIGLLISGATAIPLQAEVRLIRNWFFDLRHPTVTSELLSGIQRALDSTAVSHPFLFYGTDWLAFGHFVIALVFVGALRDPIRNKWLFTCGLIACVLVIPYAFVFGAIRNIPIFWRLIDCSFGVIGAIPLLLCSKYVNELETIAASRARSTVH